MRLRSRLTLAYLALLAFCLSGFCIGVYAYVNTELHDQFEASLKARGDGLVSLLASVSEGPETVRPTVQQLRQPADIFLVVEETKPQQAILYKTESLVDTSLPDVQPGEVVSLQTGQGPLSLYALEFQVIDRDRLRALQEAGERTSKQAKVKPLFTGKITVARSQADINASLELLRNILVGGGLAVMGIAAVLGFGVSTALLRPLERMRSAAQRIGDRRDFNLRLPVNNPRHELGRLSLTVNQMLTELEQAHASLQATLDAQRRFVGDASHELRTPVTAIRTNVEFLRRAPDAREVDRSEALADVLAEVRRMEQLIGNLLALARLEGASSPAHRPLRLDHLLTDVHRDAVRMAPADLEVQLPEPPEVWVSGDREDLRRAMWNLAENAVKYGKPSDAARLPRRGRSPEHVSMSLEVSDGQAVLTVRDGGIGIARRDQPFVFDRFWRATEVRGTPGSGLGLAITKWVAQAHGGSVDVHSAIGRGTTFTLRLPTIDPPAPGPERDSEPNSALLRSGSMPHS